MLPLVKFRDDVFLMSIYGVRKNWQLSANKRAKKEKCYQSGLV